MTKILVTGASGYIGKHVINALLNNTDLQIIAVDFENNIQNDRVICLNKNILYNPAESGLYNELNEPDILIHLAWQDGFNHNANSHLENLYSHYLFLKNMIDNGCSNINVMGSMHEVGYHEGIINENTACNPLSLYGIAKNALRQSIYTYIQDKNVYLKWLRAFYIVGDDINNKSIFCKILQMVNEGQKSFPFTLGLNEYDFIDVGQLAKQITKASIQSDIEGIINCCSGNPISLKDKVQQFIKTNNLDIEPEYGVFATRKYDSPAIWGDATKIKKIMGI